MNKPIRVLMISSVESIFTHALLHAMALRTPNALIIAGNVESLREEHVKPEPESLIMIKPINLEALAMPSTQLVMARERGVIPPSHRGFDPSLRHSKKKRKR